jgi:transposase-like protein
MWRAVESEGEVLNELVQPRRDEAAASKKPRTYGAALRLIGVSGRREHGLCANNRAGNAHRPARRRERKLQDVEPPASDQRRCAHQRSDVGRSRAAREARGAVKFRGGDSS